ncbi:acyl-CoA dehydrogenase family protein [Streptomyces sp. M10(2022)]
MASTPTASSSAPAPTPQGRRPPPRHLAPGGRHQVRGLLGRPQARQDGPEGLRHRRAGLRGRQGPRRRPAGRGEQGLLLPRPEPPQERLGIAVGAYAQAASAVRFAQQYTQDRMVFGKTVSSFQNTKFELAACKAEVDAAEAVCDRAIEALDAGELTAAEAASAKLFCTEVAHRVIDRCLQLHGGYGYMNEYPIARLYADNRVNRIYGGTSEVMKSIIAKSMGL